VCRTHLQRRTQHYTGTAASQIPHIFIYLGATQVLVLAPV
jgi:hypothetical protein